MWSCTTPLQYPPGDGVVKVPLTTVQALNSRSRCENALFELKVTQPLPVSMQHRASEKHAVSGNEFNLYKPTNNLAGRRGPNKSNEFNS